MPNSSSHSLRLKRVSLSALMVIAFFALWQAVATSGVMSALVLPTLPEVGASLRVGITDGTLLADLGVSLYRAFAGLILALLFGVTIGLAMARVRLVYWFFDPFISLMFPAPKIAFLPIFILWFGLDHTSKILLVAVSCVFPIAIATYDAAISINPFLIWSALSLGSSSTRAIYSIILPACGPRIFAALRVAVPVALIIAFTAEMVAGGGGMGATLMYSQRFFESANVYAYILSMLVAGVLLDRGLLVIQNSVPSLRDVV